MEEWLKNPFTIGLALGLAVAVLAWISGVLKRRGLRRDLRDLKKHLNLQMAITTKGHEGLQIELDALKKQNENLRVSLAASQQKPGRSEMRTLQVYERALGLMHKRAPGFAPAWQDVLAEAEGEMSKGEGGLGKLLKKVFGPAQAADPLPATPEGRPGRAEPSEAGGAESPENAEGKR